MELIIKLITYSNSVEPLIAELNLSLASIGKNNQYHAYAIVS